MNENKTGEDYGFSMNRKVAVRSDVAHQAAEPTRPPRKDVLFSHPLEPQGGETSRQRAGWGPHASSGAL